MEYRKIVLARDAIFRAMGWVPRKFDVPKGDGTCEQATSSLQEQAHAALLKRIKG